MSSIRRGGADVVGAANAGVMHSSTGSASVTPIPRKNVRRGKCAGRAKGGIEAAVVGTLVSMLLSLAVLPGDLWFIYWISQKNGALDQCVE